MQSDQFEEQIIVPTALCYTVIIKGKLFHALAHFAAPAKSLKRSLTNVRSQADALVSAVDTVISGI
jgi:hypothetical protein